MPGQGMMTRLATAPVDAARRADSAAHADAPRNLVFLFWLAVLIQIIDVFYIGFDRTSRLPLAIAMYLFLAILAAIYFHRRGEFINVKRLFLFLLLSAVYIVIPLFMYVIPRAQVFGGLTLFDWASFILAILPAWPIYIGFKAGIPFVHTYVNWWIIILILVFIVNFAFQVQAGTLIAAGGRPEVIQAGNVAGFLMEELYKTGQNFYKAINPKTWVNTAINASGIGYYTGMVERNEKEPIGLFIDNIELADQQNYVGSPVIIWADIRGKSFTEEIIVEPLCFIDKGVASGEVKPSRISILGEEHDSFSCTFNNLDKGSYRAKVGANFNFETWAYVTYTFVDQEVSRSYAVQGKSVNQELDIDRLPRAIYTNGPVMLGMGSMVDQPVGIDMDTNLREPILGVTLDNVWTEGKIASVEEFTLLVPDDFTLIGCDRGEAVIENSEDGYDHYKFTKEMQEDPRLSFQSIRCRLHIKNPESLLGGSQKVQRTFAAQAKYAYHMEKSIGFTVRE